MSANTTLNNILERIKQRKQEASSVKTKNDDVIQYNPEDQSKNLEYIDKFLKVISDNERVTITYGNVDTAFINMTTKEITLPNYIVGDRDMYIMMGSHEVSHALHTPMSFYNAHNSNSSETVVDGIKVNRNFFMCINIVEDIRIERLIRAKFPGFVSVYEKGYRKLLDSNPNFKVTAESWSDNGAHNRINIKAKAGSQVPYELEGDELDLYNEFYAYQTFDEVLKGAAKLYRLVFLEENEKKKSSDSKPQNIEEEDSNSPMGMEIDLEELAEELSETEDLDNDEAADNNSNDNNSTVPSDETEGEEVESELLDKLEKLIDSHKSDDTTDKDDYSEDLLESLNDAISDIEEETDVKFDDDIMDESEEIAEERLKEEFGGNSVISINDNNILKSIAKNPMSGLVTL